MKKAMAIGDRCQGQGEQMECFLGRGQQLKKARIEYRIS